MGDGDRGDGHAFKVSDRRKFTADGELREGAADDPESPPAAGSPSSEGQRGSRGDAGFERQPLEEPTGVDLTMLFSAMAQQALRFLGEIPNPATGNPEVDPEQARLQIDMLELLRVKCRGNMTPQEEALLDQALYQLRMLFVARAQRNP